MFSDESVFEAEIKGSDCERLVLYLERMFGFYFEKFQSEDMSSVIVVPFEKITVQPEKYLRNIASLISSDIDGKVKREMKSQNVPRSVYSDGKKLPIYNKYSTYKELSSDLGEERKKLESHVKSLMDNSDQFGRLIELSQSYAGWIENL